MGAPSVGVIGGYQTDKGDNGYTPVYRALNLPVDGAVCEIGVRDGGSLALWQELCPTGRVVGVDVNPDSTWPPGTVRVVADQTDPCLPALTDPHGGGFDLIVDDGCHRGMETAATFVNLYPLVRPGGWYVIEDWQAQILWPDLYPGMTMACMSGLLEMLDWLTDDSECQSVTYRPGMVLIRKAGTEAP